MGKDGIERGYMTADPAWYDLLKEFARTNRANPTKAETAMWNILRKNFKEYRFRRQHPIGDYIADFVSLRLRLVIEVDGGYHNEEEQIKWDRYRTEFLKNQGFTVIRFTNEEVMTNPYKIKDELTKYYIDENR